MVDVKEGFEEETETLKIPINPVCAVALNMFIEQYVCKEILGKYQRDFFSFLCFSTHIHTDLWKLQGPWGFFLLLLLFFGATIWSNILHSMKLWA